MDNKFLELCKEIVVYKNLFSLGFYDLILIYPKVGSYPIGTRSDAFHSSFLLIINFFTHTLCGGL